MRFGYARVSTYEQNLDLQTDALKSSDCDKIFTDKVSGIKSERLQLAKLKEQIRAGDTIVVWKFDQNEQKSKRSNRLNQRTRIKTSRLCINNRKHRY